MNEVVQLTEQYSNASKYMRDYRESLLSSYIERKLGLARKRTKSSSVINELLYDITKGQRQNSITIFDQSLNQQEPHSKYSHIHSRINDSSTINNICLTNDQEVNHKLKNIYKEVSKDNLMQPSIENDPDQVKYIYRLPF